MTTKTLKNPFPWEKIYGSNLGYITMQYELYQKDPSSINLELAQLFDLYGPPRVAFQNTTEPSTNLKNVVLAERLIQNIRTYGHLAAKIDPLGRANENPLLDPAHYGLTQTDLENIPSSFIWDEVDKEIHTAWDVVTHMRNVYMQSIAFEFHHVHSPSERNWLYHMVESKNTLTPTSPQKKKHVLSRLIEVDEFEKFLHRTFVGQKRFSIEGIDMLIPLLDEIICLGIQKKLEHVLMGMAHRGRLSVLAHVLGKPYETIFSEFQHSPNKDLFPSEGSTGINYGWTGDVKYHLGAEREVNKAGDLHAKVTLSNNPSHLEFVNPVVEGFTRAAQEEHLLPGYPKQDTKKALAILVHGDAAFPGEGVVAETLNLSRLRGYQTGGSIHIIVNNQLGFTTDSSDARSTMYASDLAKGYEIPVVHVNADDPEACLRAAFLAIEYRSTFQKDFLIDLIGYRRFGHNEMDDPMVTQPQMYQRIADLPSIREKYSKKLQQEGIISTNDIHEKETLTKEKLTDAYHKVKNDGEQIIDFNNIPLAPDIGTFPIQETAISREKMMKISHHFLQLPNTFTINKKLERILKRRADTFEKEGKVDWSLGETFALASILQEGKMIRLTGQDSERGTFAHRHLVFHDIHTGKTYCPLHHIPEVKASFGIYNSPLSETSVLGFEYGYNVFQPKTLVLWEAQYGDFANVSQVIFDQFLSAGRAKWGEKSSMVILLPHGYEGQGPEHSSARLERFLQSAAENNWIIAYPTSAAQYFHLLRRQAFLVNQEQARPLVVMTPKSLIRNQFTVSSIEDLEKGYFQPIYEESLLEGDRNKVKRLLLCSGKISIDLKTKIKDNTENNWNWLHLVRVEELYPFPDTEIALLISRYPYLEEIIWVQEEPKNMGAWSYIQQKMQHVLFSHHMLRYVGRPERSSPATGQPNLHTLEQNHILEEALYL